MTTVAVERIKVNAGRRPINEKKLRVLIDSIKEIGLLNPITITPTYELIAGYHRLEAFRQLGLEIPVIFLDFTGLKAELAEIDENLIRNELTELEMAECLKRRKVIYEGIHPQTKKGGDHTTEAGKQKADPALSYVKDTALQTGKSETSIKQSVKIATDLAKPVKEKIRDTPIADNKEELKALASVPKQQQAKIVEKVLSGEAGTVREVVEQKKPDPVEESPKVAPVTSPNPINQKKSARDFYADELLKLMPANIGVMLTDIRNIHPEWVLVADIFYHGVKSLQDADKKQTRR
jgi:ParB-like chromosome segregation protein Spo0J